MDLEFLPGRGIQVLHHHECYTCPQSHKHHRDELRQARAGTQTKLKLGLVFFAFYLEIHQAIQDYHQLVHN
jgi:hypothetical protein